MNLLRRGGGGGTPPLPPGLSAVVTGASSGIGADIARGLVRRGADRVVLVARRADRLRALSEELGSAAVAHPADLADPTAIAALIASEPRVDILINNAGFGWAHPFIGQATSRPERLLEMVDVNCRAVVQLTAAWAPGMVDRGRGWILNVGSVVGRIPSPVNVVYGATKAFVHSFTEALRIDLAGTGVAVHLLAPGPVRTEFFDVSRPMGANSAPGGLSLSPEQVARQALDHLFADRPRLVPGIRIAVASSAAAALPMFLFRPLARAGTRALRRTKRSAR